MSAQYRNAEQVRPSEMDVPEGLVDSIKFAQAINAVPAIIVQGLPQEHHFIYHPTLLTPMPEVKRPMDETDIVARAVDPNFDCSVTAHQRGYKFAQRATNPASGANAYRWFEFPGIVGLQVRALGEDAPQHQKDRVQGLATVESEKRIQHQLRRRLFMHVQQFTSPLVDEHKTGAFLELLSTYDPESHLVSAGLAKDIFEESRRLSGKTGVTELQLKRLKMAFDAVAVNNPRVGGLKYQIVHDALNQDTMRPKSPKSRLLRRTTGTLDAKSIQSIQERYSGYEKYLPKKDEATGFNVDLLLPTPTIGQQAVKKAIEDSTALATAGIDKLAEVDPKKAAVRFTLGATLTGALGGMMANEAAAAAPERPVTAFSLQTEVPAATVNLTTENVSLVSMTTNVESAPSKESISNAAFKKEIERRVAHSKTLTGMWAQWETVDADVLYRAILKYEKQHNHPVVNRYLILEQLTQESQLKIDAVSRAGAKGLTQFMPGTWKSHGHGKSPFDPDAAVRAQYELDIQNYNHLRKQFPHKSQDEILRLTLAAYNAGLDKHVQRGEIPPYKETRDYVRIIMGKLHDLKNRMPDLPHAAAPVRPHVSDKNSGATKQPAPRADTGAEAISFSNLFDTTTPAADIQTVSFTTLLDAPSTPTDTTDKQIDHAAIAASLDSILGAPQITDAPALSAPEARHAAPIVLPESSAATSRIAAVALGDMLANQAQPEVHVTDPATNQPSQTTTAPITQPFDITPTSPAPTPDVQPATPDTNVSQNPDSGSFDTSKSVILGDANSSTIAASAVPTLLTTDQPDVAPAISLATAAPVDTTAPVFNLAQTNVAPSADPAPVVPQPDTTPVISALPTAPAPQVSTPAAPVLEAAPSAPVEKKAEQPAKPKEVNPKPAPGKETKCAPGSKSLGVFRTSDGKQELCALTKLKSSGEESTPGTQYYIKGANGHAIVSASLSDNYTKMIDAARKDGVIFERVNSSFRTYEHQAKLAAGNSNRNLVAEAGTSLHEEGGAVDFHIIGASSANCQYNDHGDCIAPHDKEWNWLALNADKFGLGVYKAEAWHVDDRKNHWASYNKD